MTKTIDSKKSAYYMFKAKNSLKMAKIAIKEEAYDNAVMSSIHCAINTLDAVTTFYLNKRATGSHTDVLFLIKQIFTIQEYNDIKRQFSSLLGMKNASEYQPDLMRLEDAENAIKWAERIYTKINNKLSDAI